jgi:hypothetical protein
VYSAETSVCRDSSCVKSFTTAEKVIDIMLYIVGAGLGSSLASLGADLRRLTVDAGDLNQ